jgi:hypothetical protein
MGWKIFLPKKRELLEKLEFVVNGEKSFRWDYSTIGVGDWINKDKEHGSCTSTLHLPR